MVEFTHAITIDHVTSWSQAGHLVQVDLPLFDAGDVVCVLDDLAELHRLQKNIGEWNDDMALVRT